jgi:hypothetical protein
MKYRYTSLIVVFVALLIGGCKEEDKDFKNPYEGGKEALGIVTNAQQVPVPDVGGAGTVVTIAATGLEKLYKEGVLNKVCERRWNRSNRS